MQELKANIDGPDGAIIAKYYKTPSKDHDVEIRMVTEDERIHKIGSRGSIDPPTIERDVKEFFKSVGGQYANTNWTIDMK